MTKQNNVPTLRFPEFVGEWKIKKVDDITDKINSGKTPLGGESVYTTNGILFIRSQNVADNKLALENSTFIPEEINNTMKNSVVKPKDILLNITGASLGRSCVVPESFTIGNVNQHVCIIRIDKNNEPYFVQPIFASEKGQNLFTSLQTGSGREGLNFQSIKGISLHLPTLPEQTKIATFLTAVDDRLTQLKQKKTLLEQYKKGVMQKIFDQEIRFKPALSGVEGDNSGNEFPEWEVKKLGEIGEFKNGINKSSEDFGFGFPFINLMDVFGKATISNLKLDLVNANEKELKLYELNKGDVLFIRSSVKKSGVGETSLVMEDLIDTVFSGFLIRFRDTKIKLDLGFKKYCFAVRKFRENLIALSTTSANTNINQESLKDLEINLPCLAEQTKIASFLSAIDEKINNYINQISKTEQYKKGLLQQLFV